jgi:F-type H+-transporting ATPase subunit a
MSAAQHHGFQVWNLLHSDFLNHHPYVAAGTISASIILVGAACYRAFAPTLNEQTQNDAEFVPPSNLAPRNLIDLAASFVQGMARNNIGPNYAVYLPLLIFIFMWTLVNNLLGMIPGFGSATDNYNTTLAMGLVTFVYYNAMGFRAHGLKYLEHYTGHLKGTVLLVLGPLMFLIEIVSNFARPVSLGIRLRSNIFGDHVVYGIISDLVHQLGTSIGVKFGAVGSAIGWVLTSLGPVPIVALGLLVCAIQAYVFTLLTTVYIGMATAHAGEEHHH